MGTACRLVAGAMSTAWSPEEEILFEKTGGAVLRRLGKTRNPADLLAVLRDAHKGFDRAFATAPAAARDSVVCRAGCDACCHALVGVQAHEVLIVAEYIQTHFFPVELEDAITRTAAQRTAFAGKSHGEQAALNRPCALLREGSCTVHPARPEACRAHHSPDAGACRSNLDLRNEYVDVAIPGVRGRMFAVMLAIDQAAAEAGFDGQAYDFGSALNEALTDSRCAVRWMQRQPAFPADCREKGAAGLDDDSGVIRAEGFFQ